MKKRKLWSIIGSTATITMMAGLSPFISSCSHSEDKGQYKINIKQDEGGIITCSRSRANPGDLVTLTMTPEPNYFRLLLQVDAESINMLEHSEPQLTFAMPKRDVNVSGLFVSHENTVFDLYAGYTEPGKDPNYFYMDGETPVRRYPFIAPKGLRFDELTQYFPPIPTAGDPDAIFERWYWWDPDKIPYEKGNPVTLDYKFTDDVVVLVAGYTIQHIEVNNLFEVSQTTFDTSINHQQFPLWIKFNPLEIGADDEPAQFTTIGTSSNYIYCDNIREKDKVTPSKKWNVGLYEKAHYSCQLEPISTAPDGKSVEFSFQFAPKTNVDIYFDMHFAFTIGITTYTQKIKDIHVVKNTA